MSKQSAESLSIATVSIPLRPDPPDDLTEAQKALWKAITDTKPPEWFEADTLPLLRQYVIACDWHDRIAAELEKDSKSHIGVTQAEKKLAMMEKQSKRAMTLAVKMRLTQQSRYTPKAAATANKNAAGGRKPWEG